MTQPDVSLTDYALAAECGYFTYRMTRHQPLTQPFTLFFISIALAAAAGGTVHGFFLDETTTGYQILWPLTLILIGVTSLAGISIAATLQLSPPTAKRIQHIALPAFMLYVLIVLFIRRDFLIAILAYLPTLIFLGTAFLLAYRRNGKSPFLIGFLGILTMLLAATTQQMKFRIDPRYFDHNALYHLLQGIALFTVYLAAKAAITQPAE